MDNEKDLFIKEKLQKDKLISKKADDIINDFIKGDFQMNEEKFELNKEQTNTTNVNTETTKQEETTQKPKKKWGKKLLATAASLVIVFCAANVYASTQGYDNIFFMIKYLITGEQGTIEGKDNLLSDRDITISYEPINITEGLSITIKKLQIKDNEAKLFVLATEKDVLDSNTVPLTYKIYNSQNEILCNQKSAREEQNSGDVLDELVLKNYKSDDTILKLEIYKANSELIATLNIDLENRTVEVVGEEEALSKISEIELKEFLGYASTLSKPLGTNRTREEYKIAAAISWGNVNSKIEGHFLKTRNAYAYKVEEVNKILESFCGERADNFVDGNLFVKIKENGIEYFVFNEATDEVFAGECIDITNISYCNGLYTVTYTYYYRGQEPDGDLNINNYDIYEQTIAIKLNENTEFTKFRIVSIDDAIVVKEAEKSNNEETNADSIQIDTNSDIIQKLYKYILKFHAYDEKLVYQSQKVTNKNMDNQLKLATIFENLEESDASQVIKETNEYGIETKKEIFSKEIIEAKAKEIFGDDVNIQHELCSYQLAVDIIYENNQYIRYDFPGGGGTPWESSTNALVEAKEKGEELYIYDKYVHLVEVENIINGINHVGTYDIYATSDKKMKIDEHINFDEKGVFNGLDGLSREERSKVFIKNIEKITNNEIKTFKHTFKKDEKGNYYWVSTEIYN